MATQTVTIQVDPAIADIAQALAATVEQAGKSAADLLAHLKTGQPLTLSINGGGQVVVQEASSYQKLLDDLDFAESMAAVERGLADAEAGRVITLEEFAAGMRKEFGFPETRPET